MLDACYVLEYVVQLLVNVGRVLANVVDELLSVAHVYESFHVSY